MTFFTVGQRTEKWNRSLARCPKGLCEESWELFGQNAHQVHVKNRSVIAVEVHVHGALLGGEADGAVLQGEGGAGRDVLPAAETRCSLNERGWQHSIFIVCVRGSLSAAGVQTAA